MVWNLTSSEHNCLPSASVDARVKAAALAGLASVIFLAACTPSASKTVPSSSPGLSPSASVIEAAVSTDCPAAGRARAAVMSSMRLGDSPAVVYLDEPAANGGPVSSSLIRYNTNSKTKVTILNAVIDEAVVSPDGQWVSFTTSGSGTPMLQLVRMDGTRRQTLFCAEQNGGIRGLLWSADQTSLLFSASAGSESPVIFQLDTRTGALAALMRDNSLSTDYVPVSWADSSHLMVLGHSSGLGPGTELGLLDLRRGTNQPSSDLVQLSSSVAPCFDSFDDGGTVYTSSCNGTFSDTGGPTSRGPSQVTAQPAGGGPKRTVFTSQTLAIIQARAAGSGRLLLSVGNQEPGGAAGAANGLWKVNADGSGLTQLVKAPRVQGQFNLFSQTSWANVSRDGGLYAFELSGLEKIPSYTLVFGPLAGGPSTTIAARADGGQLLLVGWTTN